MNIHEYQAKDLLASYGIPVPEGRLAGAPEEARRAAMELGGRRWVIKAQIHAGGRGKAGGVKICASLDEVEHASRNMLGRPLITRQTGPEGKIVRKLWIERACNVLKEFYVGLVVDRRAGMPAFMVNAMGGMDIEAVAKRQPNALLIQNVDPILGMMPFHGRKLGFFLGLSAPHLTQFVRVIEGMYRVFVEKDLSLLEINPLALTDQGLLALDAKIVFDDNALFRHEELPLLRDVEEEDPKELEAAEYGLNYIALDGDIGCMVNGAGLAMATMDMIKLKGGNPANFLDVGGGVTEEAVAEGIHLLLMDPKVKVVLVNIFGGIVRCDVIARGLLSAMERDHRTIPLVLRLVGTNEEEGRRLLQDASISALWADELEEAAEKAVAMAKGKRT